MSQSIEIAAACKDCGLVDYFEVELFADVHNGQTIIDTYIAEPHTCKPTTNERQEG